MNTPDPMRIDRRVAIKWMLTASAGAVFASRPAFGVPAAEAPAGAPGASRRMATALDPDLLKGVQARRSLAAHLHPRRSAARWRPCATS